MLVEVQISDKLYKDIFAYCELNQLETGTFIEDLIKKYFIIEKYGSRPAIFEETGKPKETVVAEKKLKPEPKVETKEIPIPAEVKKELEEASLKEVVNVIIEDSEKKEEKPKKRRKLS